MANMRPLRASSSKRDMEPNDETARAVRAAMDNYLAAINAADLPLAVKSYGSPITLLSGEGATVFETQEAYLAMLDALFAGLRARGFSRTAWRKVVVIPMGPGLEIGRAHV
jgi:ketosteroid isomerase-like protein